MIIAGASQNEMHKHKHSVYDKVWYNSISQYCTAWKAADAVVVWTY